MTRQRICVLLTAALLTCCSLALGRAAVVPQATLLDGVYTKEQAERGAELYGVHCAECHQPDEYKGYLRRWLGLPVSFFYEIVASTMPQNNPGSLDRDEYVAVLTYMFSINGVPPGDEELGSEPETLDAVTIAVPPEGARR